MIKIKSKGNLRKTKQFLKKAFGWHYSQILEGYGQKGCELLSQATPKDSGKTANSWQYDIKTDKEKGTVSINWYNTNVIDNGKYKVNVAILLQYGHATKNGGFVQGIDYINPALKPIFETMANSAWKEVNSV